MNTRELEVLNIICAANKPLTSSEIVDRKKGLTQSTVIAVLRKLEANEIVTIEGAAHSGKVLSRTYIPGKKAKEVVAENYYKEFEMTKDILTVDELKKIIEKVYH